jgi:hypothetical protein
MWYHLVYENHAGFQKGHVSSDTAPELHSLWNEAAAHIKQGDYHKGIEIFKYSHLQKQV